MGGTKEPEAGPPLSEALLANWIIVGTHGLHGEVRVKMTTDDPERLLDINEVLVGDPPAPLTIEAVRFHKGMALVAFAGIEDLDAAEALRGKAIRVSG